MKGSIDDLIILTKRVLHFPGLHYKTQDNSNKKESNKKINNLPKNDERNSLPVSRENLGLPTLNDIVGPVNEEINNINNNINLNNSKNKEEISSSSNKKVRSSKVNFKVEPKKLSKALITPLSDNKGNKAGKISRKSSKSENSLNISGNSAYNKIKGRQSITNIKPKEVKLPSKLIKMKDMISLKYNEPIHDVKEIPRFDIYYPKNK